MSGHIKYCAIYPGIGVGRIGNHPGNNYEDGDFYIGPEVPGLVPHLDGQFKKDGRIIRQAARFRVYGFTESGEVVHLKHGSDNVQIQWKAEIANKKSAMYKFVGKYKYNYIIQEPDFNLLRNTRHAHRLPQLRTELHNAPGVREISGNNVQNDHGQYSFDGARIFNNDAPVLGELQTDEEGNLIVLGGLGHSGSFDGASVFNYVNNENWFDDTSDGPIEATVTINGETYEATPSWFICCPPRFNRGIMDFVTLWTRMQDTWARPDEFFPEGFSYEDVHTRNPYYENEDGTFKEEFQTDKVSFQRDIEPIFHYPGITAWVNKKSLYFHGPEAWFNPKAIDFRNLEKESKQYYLTKMRKAYSTMPTKEEFDEYQLQAQLNVMPALSGNGGDTTNNDPKTFVTLTKTQYAKLEAWANETVDSKDYADEDPLSHHWDKAETVAEITPFFQPYALDRASLQDCVGSAFYPGIEMTWVTEFKSTFESPWRINRHDFAKGLFAKGRKREAGEVTWSMAMPWQADYYECKVHWWPSARPDITVPESIYDTIEDKSTLPNARVIRRWALGFRENHQDNDDTPIREPRWGNLDMVSNWHKLGFIVPKNSSGTISRNQFENDHVESERQHGTTTRSANLDQDETNLPDATRNIIASLRKMEIGEPLVGEIIKALHIALLVEFTTIPAYLSAMWSINAPQLEEFNQELGSDLQDIWDVGQLLKSIFIQEMLHAHIVCNSIAGLGFDIDFLSVIPSFPTLLPHADKEIMVSLHPLTEENVNIFAEIESPADPAFSDFNERPEDMTYESIGAFYTYLIDKIDELQVEVNPDRQLGTLYPNKNMISYDIPSIIDHLKIIIEQGEGPIGDPLATTNHYHTFLKIAEKMKGGKLNEFVIQASGNWTKGLLHDPDYYDSKHVAMLKPLLECFNAFYTYLYYCFDGIWNHYPDNEPERVQWRSDRDRWVLSMRAVMAQHLPLLAQEIFQVKIPVVDGVKVHHITPAATFEKYHFHSGSLVDQLKKLVKQCNIDLNIGNLQDRVVKV